MAAITVNAAAAPAVQLPLEAGKPATSTAPAGSAVELRLTAVPAGPFRVVVRQPEVDLKLVEPVSGLESDAFEFGEETLTFTGEVKAGTVVRVRNPGGSNGRFEARIEDASRPLPPVRARQLELQLTRLKPKLAAESPQELAEGITLARGILTAQSADLSPETAARLRLKLGEALYGQSAFAEASAEFERALAICQTARCLAEAENNIAIAALAVGDTARTTQFLDRSVVHWQTAEWPLGAALAANNYGLYLRRAGRWNDSLRAFRTADSLVGSNEPRHAGVIANNRGLLATSMGDYAEARRHLERSLKLLQNSGDTEALGSTVLNLGRALMLEGRYQEAERRHREAVSLFGSRLASKAALADALANLGQVLARQGKHREARPEFERARDLYQAANARAGLGNVLLHLGASLAAGGDIEQARAALTQSLDLQRQVASPDDSAATLFELARLDRRQGRLEEARAKAAQVIEETESLRAEALGEYYRATYFGSKQSYYALLIELLSEGTANGKVLPDAAAAFAVSERSRARGFLDGMLASQVKLEQAAPANLLAQRDRAVETLRFASRELESAPPEARKRIQDRIESALADYRAAQAEIQNQTPAGRQWSALKPLSAEAVRKLLDPDTVLFSYWLGEERSYRWRVSADGITQSLLPPRREIEEPARVLLSGMERFEDRLRDPELQKQFAGARTKLGSLLLPRDEEFGGKTVVLVADGILNYVPFAALVPGNRDGADPLGFQADLVRLPSASSIESLRAAAVEKPATNQQIAILADPVFSAEDARVAPRTSATAGNAPARRPRGVQTSAPELARLPGSAREAAIIQRLARPGTCSLAEGFEASRQTFQDPRVLGARILHVSTHTLVNDAHPELSRIVLSQVGRDGRANKDGDLSLMDLYTLTKLRADLVVLSSCRTALGREIRGEGMLSLARGFFFSGVSAVIASQWQVDDQATAQFMSSFYRELLADSPVRPVTALRRAQAALGRSKRYNDPYFWASFSLSGDWQRGVSPQ